MPQSQLDELRASIQELEVSLHTAPPEMRPIMEQQIQSLRQACAMLERVQPQIEQNKQHRPALTPEVAAFFRPEPPAAVPAWVPDHMTRDALTEEWLRCPPGSQIYWLEESVGCAVPQGPGSVPIRNGLGLQFTTATRRLESQRYYENGLLRWSVDYHATGGRSQVGFYAATERLSYPEHGLHTRYAPNGTVTSQTTYVNGVPHGWSKLWEDDGFPIGATLYDQGRAIETVLPDGSRRAGA